MGWRAASHAEVGMTAFTESVVEHAALAWLESVGWSVRRGAEIAPGEPYGQVVLAQQLRYCPSSSPAGFG